MEVQVTLDKMEYLLSSNGASNFECLFFVLMVVNQSVLFFDILYIYYKFMVCIIRPNERPPASLLRPELIL